MQRADAGGKAGAQIVPRPAETNALVVERVVVADDASVDLLDAGGLQLFAPLAEQPRGRAVPIVDAWIAGADDEQVAVEDAVADRAEREQAGFVAEIPTEFLGGAGQVTTFIVEAGIMSLPALSE